LLSFLASAEIIAAVATVRVLQNWPSRLAGDFTLAVAGSGVESSDAAAARIADLLAHDNSVGRVWVIAPAPEDALAARIMGVAEPGDEFGPARLIGVAGRPGALVTADQVLARLRAQGFVAGVDDHDPWTGPLERITLLAATTTTAAMLLLLAAFDALIASGVRRGVDRSLGRVSLLLQLGASDAMLARPFRTRFAGEAIVYAALGALAAAGVGAAMIRSPETAIWLAAHGATPPKLHVRDIAAAAVWPLVAWAMAELAAGRAAVAAFRSLA
jgi:cell division protein FtsX